MPGAQEHLRLQWVPDRAARAPRLTRAVDEVLGAPYELGGRGPGVFDCFGLVVWLLGVEIPPGRLRTELRALRAAFRELGQGERVLPGDVLGWESLPGRLREQHVALYEGPMVVEARAGAGVHRTSWSDALSERGTPCVYRRRGC